MARAIIPAELARELQRFKTTSPPIIYSIDRKTDPPVLRVDTTTLDEDEDFSIETLARELPDGAPRFIVMAYKPEAESFSKVILIDWIPNGCETALSMFHIGTLPEVERLIRPWKVIQITDGEEGLTEEILDAKLAGRRV